MRTLMSGPAWVSYAQIYVESTQDSVGLEECFVGQQNGLCGAASPGTLFLVTGLHTGDVGFTVELYDAPPPLDDSWEEIVEASYRPRGAAMLMTWAGDGGWWDLDLEPIDYRVRYCGWGMDAGHQAGPPMDGDPLVDRYLLQFWPAPAAPDRVLKQTSAQAAYWHRFAREQPTLEDFAERKRQRALRDEERRLAERAAAWGGSLPTPRIENTMHGQELSALDRSFVDALEQTEPETLRAMARFAARQACQQAGYADLERIAGILDRMDRGADWLETLNGPPPPVDPEAKPQPVIHHFVAREYGWFADRDAYDNTSTVVSATFDEDSFKAAVNTIWLATGPFTDKPRLIAELRQRFLTSPGL
ncbi:hypothetical protein [Kribbella sp. NPDC004536]|uniref:hypothetical protein n=1 Tax=Kribbella sp. NPDC004536 TaxID=3364106 RepID=UPI0036A45CC6